MPVARFNWDFNVGHVLTVTAMLAGFGVAYTNFVSNANKLQEQIERQDIRLVELKKEDDLRADKYIPIIDLQARSQEVQDTRIQNLALALTDLRKIAQDLTTVTAQTHEDIAVLKTRLERQADRTENAK